MQKHTKKKTIISLLMIAVTASIIFAPLASATRYTSYTLNVDIIGSGGVTPGTSSYNYGDIVTVRATPSIGYAFQGWYLDGQFQGVLNSINITMFTSYWLEAVFVQRQVTLTVSVDPVQAGSTSINPGVHTYSAGQTVNIQETPNEGCSFDGWFMDGNYLGTGENITVIMNRDHLLNAYFSPHDFNILSVTTSEGGYSSMTGVAICTDNNETQTISATPFDGFTFSYWIVNHEFSTDNPITLKVSSNQGLKAVFTQKGVTPVMPILSAPPVTPTPAQSTPHSSSDNQYKDATSTVDNSTWIEIALVAVIIVLVSFIVVRGKIKSRENKLSQLDY
jgi:hypothetical protein